MRDTKQRTVLAVVLALAAAVGTGAVYRPATAEPPEPKDPPPAVNAGDTEGSLKKVMLENARKAFEQDLTHLKAMGGDVNPERLYVWSCRWLEAELELTADVTARKAALQNHLNRMRELERMTTALERTGQGRGADAAAGTYFRSQAELWLARGRVR